MQKYICEVCGYIDDPEEGDPVLAFSRTLRSMGFLTTGLVQWARPKRGATTKSQFKSIKQESSVA